MTPLEFLIAGLAVFRLAVLFSQDTGPARVFSKLRAFLKREAKQHQVVRKSDVHRGIECLRCSSVWVAAPVAVYAVSGWRHVIADGALLCLALSAVAILWHRAFPAR